MWSVLCFSKNTWATLKKLCSFSSVNVAACFIFDAEWKKYVPKLWKEQSEVVRAKEHALYKTESDSCLVCVDVLILTGFNFILFFLSLQELHYYCLHWGPSAQQPEPSPLSPADVQPGSERGHADRSRPVEPAGSDAPLINSPFCMGHIGKVLNWIVLNLLFALSQNQPS